MGHIVIDGTPAINDIRAIRRYCKQLIEGLARIEESSNRFSIICLSCRGKSKAFSISNPRFDTAISRIPGKVLRLSWNLFSRPAISDFIKEKADIVHFPGGVPYIPADEGLVLTTLHGFSHQIIPERFSKERVDAFNKSLEKAVSSSDRFITVSETNKKELNRLWSVSLDKITAIPLGVGEEFKELEISKLDECLIRKRYNLGDKKFIFYLGAIEAHKNVEALIDAFAMLDAAVKKNFNLVLSGAITDYARHCREKASRLGLDDRVVFTGFIDPDSPDMPRLYNMAELFVFPSFYEGWASPPLEAMRCGTPAIVSDIPSLRESTGGTACYCSPEDACDIAKKIMSLLEDRSLYDDVKEKGRSFAERQSWAACASRTMQLYNERLIAPP